MKEKFRIVRPINLLIVAITMVIVLFKFRNHDIEMYWEHAILLILPAMLTAAAGYVINDIFDVKTDKINKPHFLTVGKLISTRNAWILYGVLTAISLGISLYFSFRYMNINFSISLMLALYAVKLKGLPLIGNLIIAMCSASVVAVCLLLATFETRYGFLNFAGYVIFAFFTSLVREIVKDLQDMEGDKAEGLKTYPLVAGEKGARILVFVLSTILILLCGIYAVLAWGIGMLVSAVIMAVLTISLFYFINHLANAKTSEAYFGSSKLLKYIMIVGVINLLFS